MKQAKIALTATAVLAIIGGAIAFKSRSTGTPYFVKTGPKSSASCTVDGSRYITTSNSAIPFVSYATQAITSTTVCPLNARLQVVE